MGIRKRLYELFEYSWLMMRQNPGGTSAYLLGYLLGFAGTVNIEGALDPETKKAKLKIKVGGGATQMKVVDFSDAEVDELTPADAVVILEKAGFENCKFSVDSKTRRLKLAPLDSKVRIIQIYGDLAAALNFGNCRLNQGKGCYLWGSLDGDLKSVNETENWEEDKKIENDAPLGKKVILTIPGRRGSTQIVLTDRLASREAKQMINGGIWIEGNDDKPDVYEPPVNARDDARNVDVLTFSKIMEKHDNVEGDEKFVRERLYVGGVGHMVRTGGSGNWSDSEYTLTVGSYTGDDKQEHASPRESDYTKSQYDALGLDNIIDTDWADGMGISDDIDNDNQDNSGDGSGTGGDGTDTGGGDGTGDSGTDGDGGGDGTDGDDGTGDDGTGGP
jgi:hypothetical protein